MFIAIFSQEEFTFADDLAPDRSGKCRSSQADFERARRSLHAHRAIVPYPRATAATAAPVEPVPELMVSPAPRSQKRTSMVCSSTRRTKETLVRLGKCGCDSISAPSARQSKSKSSTGTAHCGLPTQTKATSRGPAASGRMRSAASRISARPMFISNSKFQVGAGQQAQGFDARAGANADHARRPGHGGSGKRRRSACRCRRSRPCCRRSCRAGWRLRHRRRRRRSTSIQPSAPTPVWRSQMARARAGRVLRVEPASRARRDPDVPAPGEQEIVLGAVRLGEGDFHGPPMRR